MTKARDIASAAPAPSTVSATELGYLDGTTSAIQTQINSKIGQSTAINPTIVDAKGDIIAASAADTVTRLAVGANDTVLTADSSTGTGLKWATPSAGGLTLINAGGTSFSGSDFTISSIPTTYKQLRVVCVNYSINTAGYIELHPNGSSTLCNSQVQVSIGHSVNVGAYSSSGAAIHFNYAQDIAGNATDNNQLVIDIFNVGSTSQFKQIHSYGTFGYSGGRGGIQQMGEIRTTSAITSLKFFTNRTFNGGTVYVYGVN
jgi:hypothetical protein